MTLYDAAVYGDVKRVEAILSERPKAVAERDEFGFTALHGVVGEEHTRIAQLLMDHGADVNARNDDGITPLHVAAWPQMIELLVRNGADVNARSHRGETPLITQAAEAERDDVIEALLKAGADVNCRSGNGQTALSIARGREDAEKVALLKRFGAKN